jgi:hypothetical protein
MLLSVWLGSSFIAIVWLLLWAVKTDARTRNSAASGRKEQESITVFTPRDSADYLKAFGRKRPF